MDQTIRKGSLIAFMHLFFVTGVYPHNQEYFLQGNSYYQENKCQNALEVYKKITNKGIAVWYNMGLCFSSLGQPSHALACWRNAQYGANNDEYRNCMDEIIKTYASVGVTYAPLLRERIHMSYCACIPLGVLQLLFLVTWFLLCWLLWIGFMARWRYVFYSFLLVIIGITSFLLYMRYFDDTVLYAVVHEVAPVYIGPGVQYQEVGKLNKVSEVCVAKMQDDWCKVNTGELIGWVNASHIEMVGCALGKK